MPHSPGPWHPSELPPCAGDYICDNNGEVIAAVAEFNENGALHVRFPNARDNARLIAAAPNMLAALQQVEREMQAGFGSSFGETREQVRRAIAAATLPPTIVRTASGYVLPADYFTRNRGS